MAFRVDLGEMRSRVNILRLNPGTDEEGTPTENPVDIFGGKVWCKWVWTHGTEVFDDLRAEIRNTATLTMHYSPKVKGTDIVMFQGDRYEIISLNNVVENNAYLEIKVKRIEKA